MIRALSFIVQICLFVGIIIALMRLDTLLHIAWGTYSISIHSGLFILCASVMVLALVFGYGLFLDVVNFPSRLSYYRTYKKQGRINTLMGAIFSALHDGDVRVARKRARHLKRYAREDESGDIEKAIAYVTQQDKASDQV